MMAQRGVRVSYDTIHQWCRKFGQTYATGLRRRQERPGAPDRGHRITLAFWLAGSSGGAR